MDSVQTIMKNANNLLTKALKLEDCMDVSFKAASLLEEQNKLQTLFSGVYSDRDLVKQKIATVNAYIYLEYAMIPYDEECKQNYYTRCDIKDLYTKCRKYVISMLNSPKTKQLSEFIAQCYSGVSLLNDEAVSSTGVLDNAAVQSLKKTYAYYTNE